MGNVKEARKTADDAVASGPFLAQAHLSLGMVALKQKEDVVAKESTQKAVELDPTNGALYLALGDVLVRASDLQGAISAYETFLKMGGSKLDVARVHKALEPMKKKLAASR
jgi:Tfp pilus assembly protein PilF